MAKAPRCKRGTRRVNTGGSIPSPSTNYFEVACRFLAFFAMLLGPPAGALLLIWRAD